MNILLAEDDHHIATIAKMTLENIGKHQVTHVENGEEALKIILDKDFDVILLDEMMPIMNGLKVCEEFRRRSSKKTPVIFLSAKSQHEDLKLFKQMGDGFIAKPFDPVTICQTIENIVHEYQGKK